MHDTIAPAFDPARTSHFAAHVAPVPEHVAIIMDGNGRWAQRRGLPRTQGHRRGVEALRSTVRAARTMGIRTLTLYSFSSENWSRPPQEVADLMGLLKLFVRRDLADLHKENVRVHVIGGRDDLPSDIRPLIEEAEAVTRDNDGQNLVLAFNYGGRDELARAAKRMAQAIAEGRLSAEAIDAGTLGTFLDTAAVGDPDLVIRTGGEQRLSNFLLFQAAYAELVFTDRLWPDFDIGALHAAVAEFQRRDRRFGGVPVAMPQAASA